MVHELINAVLPIVTNGPFVIACGITNADQITRDVIHSRGRLRVDHHIPSALDAVEQLRPLLPRHHAESRRLADLAHRLSTPGRRANWARELKQEHSALVARLARCRNSLSHGGPYDAELGATVKPFAIQCARWTVSVAVDGLFDGASIQAASEQAAGESRDVLHRLATARTALEALTGSPKET